MSDEFKAVSLMGVPRYRQGRHDGLCAYYTSAMLLASLFPKFATEFGEGEVRRGVGLSADDPLIKHAPEKDKYRALSRWFYEGESLHTCATILNNVVKDHTPGLFQHVPRYLRAEGDKKSERPWVIFDEIAASIRKGFPVALGWSSDDLGNHAVLVHGYRIGEKLRFLEVHDPGGDKEIVWDAHASACARSIDLIRIRPERWTGPRPDRMVMTKDGEKIHQRYWWTPDGVEDWHNVDDLFRSTADWHLRDKRTPRHRIIEALRRSAPKPLLKNELIAVESLKEGEWEEAIKDLRARGLVIIEGEKKGTRYSLRTKTALDEA